VISRQKNFIFYDISIQQRWWARQWKPLEHNFENFTIRGRFSKKRKNCFLKFPGLATSAIITLQWLQMPKTQLNGLPKGCLVSVFKVRISSNSFPWAVRCAPEAHPQTFLQFRLYTYGIDNAAVTINYWVTWHHASWNAVIKQLISHVWMLKQNSNNETFLSARMLTEILFHFYISKILFELNCNKLT